MLDYETLRVIWWLLLGVLLIGFAVTDGFDLGVAAAIAVRSAATTTSGALMHRSRSARSGRATKSG